MSETVKKRTTDGPWHYVPWHIAEGPSEVRHADGWLVCTTSSDDSARLIAAAPDLLAAVKAAMAWRNSLRDPELPIIEFPELVLRTAIANAEGR